MRFNRAANAFASQLVIALILAALVLVLRKTDLLAEQRARTALVGLAALPVVMASVFWLLPVPRLAAAMALDRAFLLHGRVSNALAFSRLQGEERTPFVEAAIADVARFASWLRPSRAVPLRMPRDGLGVLALGLVLAAIALVELRTHKPVLTAKPFDALDVPADDLDAMREFLRNAEQRAQTDEAKAATREFNQLVEELAQRRLDRTEAFRRMQALENKLQSGSEADRKAFEEALAKIGEELKRAELTKPAGEALAQKDLPKSEKELRDLAKRLRGQGNRPDKAQLERMRDALRKAAEGQDKRREALAQQRDEARRELLRQKEKMGDAGASEEERSLLRKKERELDRLDRDTKAEEASKRQLDRLDRELAKAAEDLMRDLGLSAKDLDEGAEDINRMARDQMTDQEKAELRQKLEELRENLRRQGQGGAQQIARLKRFGQRARGGQQGPGQQGESGGSQAGEGDPNGEGQEKGGSGKDGQGKNGQGKNGAGEKGGEQWVIGPGGEKVLVLSKGRGSGQRAGQSGSGSEPGGGDPQRGPGWGTGHDARMQGQATNPRVGTQDTQVAGGDTGQGSSRSEVILGAADRGFSSRGYQTVYREYHTVAEEALGKDEIPGGYRFYVRRYFQLIRPREGE